MLQRKVNPDLLTPEFCEAAIERYVKPVFEANGNEGLHTRREGSLLVLRDPRREGQNDSLLKVCDSPDRDFYETFVVYEHTFGENSTGGDQVKAGTLTLLSLKKAYGAFVMKMDYDKVLETNHDFVSSKGLTSYPGAVYGDIAPYKTDIIIPGVVTSYAGVWWRHDDLYARLAHAGLKADLTPELDL